MKPFSIKQNSLVGPAGLLILLSVVLFFISGCSGLTGVGQKPDVDPGELAARLKARQDRIQYFAGRGGIRIQTKDNQHYFDMMMVSALPNRLRLVIYDPMGRPTLTMASDGNTLRVLDHRQKVLRAGPASRENVSRYLPLGMGLSELITLMSGGQPLEDYEPSAVTGEKELGAEIWRLDLVKNGGRMTERIWMTPPGDRIRKVELGSSENGADFRMEYDKHREISGEVVPFHILMTNLKQNEQITISYSEVKVNPDLPDKLFTIDTPPGIRVLPLDQTTDEGI